MINHIKAEEKNVILNVYLKERILYKKKRLDGRTVKKT